MSNSFTFFARVFIRTSFQQLFTSYVWLGAKILNEKSTQKTLMKLTAGVLKRARNIIPKLFCSCVAFTYDNLSGRCEMFIIGPWSYTRFKSDEIQTNIIYIRENLYGDIVWKIHFAWRTFNFYFFNLIFMTILIKHSLIAQSLLPSNFQQA